MLQRSWATFLFLQHQRQKKRNRMFPDCTKFPRYLLIGRIKMPHYHFQQYIFELKINWEKFDDMHDGIQNCSTLIFRMKIKLSFCLELSFQLLNIFPFLKKIRGSSLTNYALYDNDDYIDDDCTVSTYCNTISKKKPFNFSWKFLNLFDFVLTVTNEFKWDWRKRNTLRCALFN